MELQTFWLLNFQNEVGIYNLRKINSISEKKFIKTTYL